MSASKLAVAAAALSMSAAALAAGTHSDGHGANIGEPGKASEATRTITVEMYDNYYEPENLAVKAGETVRLVIENKGALVHEFSIATADMHEASQKNMQMLAEHGVINGDRIDHGMMEMDMGDGHSMKHDDPNSVLMEPGESREIVWTFSEASDLEFACNVPGHYQAGMVGGIDVE
jgi:uncharacterized cupredoxin-like copper-binding protein